MKKLLMALLCLFFSVSLSMAATPPDQTSSAETLEQKVRRLNEEFQGALADQRMIQEAALKHANARPSGMNESQAEAYQKQLDSLNQETMRANKLVTDLGESLRIATQELQQQQREEEERKARLLAEEQQRQRAREAEERELLRVQEQERKTQDRLAEQNRQQQAKLQEEERQLREREQDRGAGGIVKKTASLVIDVVKFIFAVIVLGFLWKMSRRFKCRYCGRRVSPGNCPHSPHGKHEAL